MHFRLTTLKLPPPNVNSPIFCCNLFSLWAPPMILLTAGALTDPQLQMCTRLMQGWVASAGWHRPGGIDRVASAGCPPPTKILATPVKATIDLVWFISCLFSHDLKGCSVGLFRSDNSRERLRDITSRIASAMFRLSNSLFRQHRASAYEPRSTCIAPWLSPSCSMALKHGPPPSPIAAAYSTCVSSM